MISRRIQPGPGQESVWDYPRPPRIEATSKHILVNFHGVTIAESSRALRVLETSHPPVHYLPPEDVRLEFCAPGSGHTVCEWKGRASYYTITAGDTSAPDAAWYYHRPTPAFAALKDHVAFYPAKMDACYVDGERVQAQPGNFYGGWITRDIVGPFKEG
jgi:uncharacterized protein (DUF427 family)